MNVLRSLIGKVIPAVKPRVVVKHVTHRTPVGPASSRPIVERSSQPLWLERHWTKDGRSYNGFYRTPYGSWQGQIEETLSGMIRFYISNPPSCLSNHSHFSCFLPKGNNTYEIHFARPARSASDGIDQIERILAEAHGA